MVSYDTIRKKAGIEMGILSKAFETLFIIAGIFFLLWIGASWIDVIADNSTTAIHASWNLFVLLTK